MQAIDAYYGYQLPIADDIDLAIIVTDESFEKYLITIFDNKIAKNGTKICLQGKSYEELLSLYNDINNNLSFYNNYGKSFTIGIKDGIIQFYGKVYLKPKPKF